MQLHLSPTKAHAQSAIGGTQRDLGSVRSIASQCIKPDPLAFIKCSRPFALTMLLACCTALLMLIDWQLAGASPVGLVIWAVLAQLCAFLFILHCFSVHVRPAGSLSAPGRPRLFSRSVVITGLYRPPAA